MPRPGLDFADSLLNKLLNRVEDKPDRVQAVGERLPVKSWLSDDRDDLNARLRAAETAKAVTLEMGKNESRHLIERVVLADTAKLYQFLGRTPKGDAAAAAIADLRARLPDLPEAMAPLFDVLETNWRRGRALAGLTPESLDLAERCLLAVAALADGRFDGQDLRTFSRRATGDSKFVEGNMGKIIDLLRMVADVPEELDAEEVLASHGIARYPQPCLLSGPVSYQGQSLPTKPYIGLAPEMISGLGIIGAPQWILTIENLASFNRQARERPGDGILLYTGGFPSDATLACLLALARSTDCPIYHWGDIDAGGIKIAYRIERALASVGRPLHLHLMDPDLARRHGQPVAAKAVFRIDVSASVIAGLAAFLGSMEAHLLEQEELDPALPAKSE
jgi:Uncharacterized protein conserved in bacteria C-term(DUF2220)./Uncharacterized protein conserved in bacteria N-term (DUF3322).